MAEIQQEGDAKLSTRTHPLYDDYIDDWNFFEESTKGGRQYLEAGHLFSHRLESQGDDFSERKKRAYYLNFCDRNGRVYLIRTFYYLALLLATIAFIMGVIDIAGS